MVVKLNIMNINKQCSKLKDWYFKMPNFSYCQPLAARLGDRTMKKILLAYKKGIARPQIAHLVFAVTQANPEKTKRAIF